MTDIIHLLPESVANQIAAGEVIQRPASAVKELMENAIDAGATEIKLIIKDAGKTLIQVVDNGIGMSETDARMSFQRHATSKIEKADDLFRLRTNGFRGEALASIAAIAQVEMKTRREQDTAGIQINIEGSEVTDQQPCSFTKGTSISVKNLFYNVPARRNFLKSNQVEFRHIVDEFERIALAYPALFFSMFHDGQELFHLTAANLKQRIVHVFGNNFESRLVPVEEKSTVIHITGFIGKPEFARKSRAEQFIFVNNRYIRSPYLMNAIVNAYEGLLPEQHFPFYCLFIEIEPSKIDVNVHPTKTEIKFEDEKIIYAILRSAVKRSLGQNHIAPSLDFNQNPEFSNIPPLARGELPKVPAVHFNQDYNPFETSQKGNYSSGKNKINWESLYEIAEKQHRETASDLGLEETLKEGTTTDDIEPVIQKMTFQLHNQYIVTQIKSGLMLVDQQAAHERILYERFLTMLDQHKGSTQQCLFPQTLDLSPQDFNLVMELEEELKSLGFDFRMFGKNSIVIEGVPADIEHANESGLLEEVLELYKKIPGEVKLQKREALAKSLARGSAIKPGKILGREEMNVLIDELFGCSNPNYSPWGKNTITTISLEELSERFIK